MLAGIRNQPMPSVEIRRDNLEPLAPGRASALCSFVERFNKMVNERKASVDFGCCFVAIHIGAAPAHLKEEM